MTWHMHKALAALVLSGCVGVIDDANTFPGRSAGKSDAGTAALLPDPRASIQLAVAAGGTQGPAPEAAPAQSGTPAKSTSSATNGDDTRSGASAGAAAGGGTRAAARAPATADPSRWDPTVVNAGGESVGVGDIMSPALGPEPSRGPEISGAPFILVKNWNFGADGTITDMSDLVAEFQFHDQFGSVTNSDNSGSVTVAPNAQTATDARGLGLPNDRQPLDDASRPYREFTSNTLQTHVRALSSSASSIDASRHDAGNGSFMAKWSLPKGGSHLKQDILWESRVRIAKPVPGFWFSLWSAGNEWDNGAAMDVVESFGTPNIGPGANAFHVNSIGGNDKHPFRDWISELTGLGVTQTDRDLSEWHVFTWIYLRDDTYQVFYDEYLVQQGTLLWTQGGTPTGDPLNMSFLFDLGWGHTQVSDVNITLPVTELPLTYELDYSRVYVRN